MLETLFLGVGWGALQYSLFSTSTNKMHHGAIGAFFFFHGVQCTWGRGYPGPPPAQCSLGPPFPVSPAWGQRGLSFPGPSFIGLHQGLLPSLEEGRGVPRRFPGAGGQAVPEGGDWEPCPGCSSLRCWGASSLRPPFRRDPGRGGRLPARLPGCPA